MDIQKRNNMELGSRFLKPIKGKKDSFLYINCIGEEFIFKNDKPLGKRIVAATTHYYWETKIPSREPEFLTLRKGTDYFCTIKKISKKGYYLVHNLGQEGAYTDLAKTPASAVLVLDKWYQKFGYPKESKRKQ